MKIDFKTNAQKLFAKPYYVYRKAKNLPYRYVLIYGGASSSKSYSVHQDELISLITEQKKDILFVRKDASDIYDSCYKLLQNLASQYDIYNLFRWAYSNQKREISNMFGKRILFRGVHDPQKIKSIANIGRIVVEEADQLDEADFNELDRRARGIKDIQIVLIFNPIDERHWLKKKFFDSDYYESLRYKFTYQDNKNKDGKSFLTPEDMGVLEALKKTAPNDHKVYALGEWGIFEAKNAYFSAFDETGHISDKAKFVPGKEIRISFDFNVDNTTCIMSHAGFDFIHFFREYSAANLPKLLDKIEKEYGRYAASFKITGDRSGLARHHMQSDNTNSYRMIKSRLRLKDAQFKIVKNPPHKDNRFTCNTILAYHPNVLFHPSMADTIYDLKYVECDDNENIIKKDRSIANQKVDHGDCLRYTLNTFHYSFCKKYLFRKKVVN